MKKTLVALLFVAALAAPAFAQDISAANYDTGTMYRVKNAIPNVPAYPCNFASSTLAPTGVTIATSATAITASLITTGTRLIRVYPSVDMYWGNSAVASATTNPTLTAGTAYWFAGTNDDLKALYFRSGSVSGTLTVLSFGD